MPYWEPRLFAFEFLTTFAINGTLLSILDVNILEGNIQFKEKDDPNAIFLSSYKFILQNPYLKSPFYSLLEIFKMHINYSFGCYRKGNQLYSPYFALCQSSGTGKTRLVLELARSMDAIEVPEYRVIYICLRDLLASGSPARTKTISDFILAETVCESKSSFLSFFRT